MRECQCKSYNLLRFRTKCYVEGNKWNWRLKNQKEVQNCGAGHTLAVRRNELEDAMGFPWGWCQTVMTQDNFLTFMVFFKWSTLAVLCHILSSSLKFGYATYKWGLFPPEKQLSVPWGIVLYQQDSVIWLLTLSVEHMSYVFSIRIVHLGAMITNPAHDWSRWSAW